MGGAAMSVAAARRAALEVLRRVRERDAYGPETLDAVLAASSMSDADISLATRLAYGTLETAGVLDEAIDRHVDRPKDVEARVRDALRLSTYELFYARTPARAAVHQGVEAVRAVRPRAAGMANAVLRKVAQESETFPWGDPDTDVAALARLTGHPTWLADLFAADLGPAVAATVMRADAESAPLYLWHDPFLGTLEDAMESLRRDGAEPSACDPPGCIEAGVPSAAVRGTSVSSGLCTIADAAAQVAAAVVGPYPGGVVIDLAAGRGTKTAQMQAISVAAGAPARVFAVDIHAFKAKVLAERMETLAVPGVETLVGDATHVAGIAGLPGTGEADAVLLDAPCSGLGTLRRRPEKRWRVRPEEIEALAGLQSAMLDEAASLVRPGGVVVYSTCSLARRENHDVVRAFLESEAGDSFTTRLIRDAVPAPWQHWIGPEGYFQSVPELSGPDGHFVAALERKG
jgi:16S rRNA (cytosine967-C5)-methyltransferase